MCVCVCFCEYVRTVSKDTNHRFWWEQWRDIKTIVNSADREETCFRLDSLTVQKSGSPSQAKDACMSQCLWRVWSKPLELHISTHQAVGKIDTSIHPSQTRTHLLSSALAACSPVISVLAKQAASLNQSRDLQSPPLCFNFPCVSPPLWNSVVSSSLHSLLSFSFSHHPLQPPLLTSPLSSILTSPLLFCTLLFD